MMEGRNDVTLVHGTIQGAGQPPNPHAWVRFDDGTVLDPVLGDRMPAEEYRTKMNAVEHVTYTADELAEHVMEHQHWGPWDD